MRGSELYFSITYENNTVYNRTAILFKADYALIWPADSFHGREWIAIILWELQLHSEPMFTKWNPATYVIIVMVNRAMIDRMMSV